MRRVPLCGCTARAGSAAAAASPAPAVQTVEYTEAGASHESLSNGYGSWNEQYLRIVKRNGDRQQVYGELQSVDRYGKHDDAILVGMYMPLAPDLLANVEGSASNSHLVLPSSSVAAGVQYSSGSHWFEGLSFRNTVYDAGTVNSAAFTLEHYWRAYRLSYTLNARQSRGNRRADRTCAGNRPVLRRTQRLRRYRVYRRTRNRQFRRAGTCGTRISGWNVNGRHWFGREWALAYGFSTLVKAHCIPEQVDILASTLDFNLLLRAGYAAAIVVAALSLAAILQVSWMRVSVRGREKHLHRFRSLWAPLLKHAATYAGALPRVSARDMFESMMLWNSHRSRRIAHPAIKARFAAVSTRSRAAVGSLPPAAQDS